MSTDNSIRSGQKNNSNESHEFQFRGIWLPAIVFDCLCSKQISCSELLLLIIVESLVKGKGKGCWASNTYLSQQTGVGVRHLQRSLDRLIQLELLERTTVNHTRYLKTCWSVMSRDDLQRHGGDDLQRHGGVKLGVTHNKSKTNKRKNNWGSPASSSNGEQLFPGIRQPRSAKKGKEAPQEYKKLDQFFRKWFREWNEKTGFRLSQADGAPHWQQLVERDRVPIEEVRRVVFWYCVKFQFGQNQDNYTHMPHYRWTRLPMVTGAEQFRKRWDWISGAFKKWLNENAGVPDDPVNVFCLEQMKETGTHPWDNDTL